MFFVAYENAFEIVYSPEGNHVDVGSHADDWN